MSLFFLTSPIGSESGHANLLSWNDITNCNTIVLNLVKQIFIAGEFFFSIFCWVSLCDVQFFLFFVVIYYQIFRIPWEHRPILDIIIKQTNTNTHISTKN